MFQREQYDILIVGAGLAGSALACALADSGLHIGLIEAQPLSLDAPPSGDTVRDFDLRVSALTHASQRFLKQIGAWPGDLGLRSCAYTEMHVWDGEGTASIDFDCQAVRQPCLGHIVENRATVHALLKRLQQVRGVDAICPATVEQLERGEREHTLVLADGRRLRAPLIVGADGAMSRLRELAGFPLRQWPYGHSAIVCTVQVSEGHQFAAWQRFMDTGPLAFLPLSANGDDHQLCSIVWSAETDEAKRLASLDDSAFMAALGRAFEHRLGEIVAVGPRASFPLTQRHAIDYVQPGIALVADAAHTIHPLAGQGINLGYQDVQALAEEIKRGLARGLAVGHPETLARYQRRRKVDNLAMMATMEGFKRLFGARQPWLRWARNAGMRAVNQLGPLKQQLVKQAMGL